MRENMDFKTVKNPYVATYSKYAHAWTVCGRFVIDGNIKFHSMCQARDEDTARLIAKALNAYSTNQQGE
jgi:hypothetical protein